MKRIALALLLLVVLPLSTDAATSYTIGTGAYVTIDEFGVCERDISTSGSRMVPTWTASEWSDFRSKATGITTATCNCNLPWGGTLAHGGSVTAHNTASGCGCAAQTRTCSGAVLSGSYTLAGACAACTCALPWGGTIAVGQQVMAHGGNGCGCNSEVRTCQSNGVLSGSYTLQGGCSVCGSGT